MDLLHTTFAGTLIAGAMACYTQIRGIIDRFIGLFIVKFIVTDEAAESVSAYLWKNGKIIRWGPRYFRSYTDFVKKLRARQLIPVEQLSGSTTFFFVDKKILWTAGANEHSEVQRANRNITVSFLRWSFNPEKLVQAAIQAMNDVRKGKKNRFRIMYKNGAGSIHSRKSGNNNGEAPTTAGLVAEGESELAYQTYNGSLKLIGYDISDIGSMSDDKTPFKTFCFDEYIIDAIKEIEFWKEHEAWFKDRSIPWRRGWMFESPPGCGKTTLVRCIGMHFDLPVIVFDLASMSNSEFENAWDSLSQHTPCIALIEDIDRVFNKDVNVIGEQGGGLSFDKLLNCISGIKVCDGVFTIITTNHIDKVDPSLGIAQENGVSTRPGRMDRIIKLTNPSEKCRRVIADRILEGFPFEIEPLVLLGKNDTVAQFQDRCCQKALELLWGDYKK